MTAAEKSPALRYLALLRQSIERMRASLPHFTRTGETMAGHLVESGGNLFTPDLDTYWPSEFGGRAGGLMGLKPSNYLATSAHDVAFTTLPDPRAWKPHDDPRWKRLLDSPAQIIVIGPESDVPHLPAELAPRFSFTGGATSDEGLYAHKGVRPLAPLRPFEQLVRGWLTTGEMIAACTRMGRMPTIWMSVWLEGALVRNASFFKHDNLREPWHAPLFHEKIYIPPLAPGHVARSFLEVLESTHATLTHQSPAFAKAGLWMSEALRVGKKVSTVLVGHSYPQILELKEASDYPLEWLPSISDLTKAHPCNLGSGDVALHLGYSPVAVADVGAILARGVRFIYSSPYGRPAELNDHPNLLWLDLPWRPADATVDVPGYSVRILPMSSSAHTMAYFALVSELAERMSWK